VPPGAAGTPSTIFLSTPLSRHMFKKFIIKHTIVAKAFKQC